MRRPLLYDAEVLLKRGMHRRRLRPALAIALLAAHPAWAIDYRSVAADAAILYDGPSTKARKLFVLNRDYPVEVLVVVEGWTKVRDASGDLAWIEAPDLGDRRMVMAKTRAKVHEAADESSKVVFEVDEDVLLELIDVAGTFVHVRHADGSSGYIRIVQVWGL